MGKKQQIIEAAIAKIHAEATCKATRSPQFMADFAEAVIRHMAQELEGAQ